jgi:hypothetical protein
MSGARTCHTEYPDATAINKGKKVVQRVGALPKKEIERHLKALL